MKTACCVLWVIPRRGLTHAERVHLGITVPTAPARCRASLTPTPTQRRMHHAHSALPRNLPMQRARGGAGVELDITHQGPISVDSVRRRSIPIRQTHPFAISASRRFLPTLGHTQRTSACARQVPCTMAPSARVRPGHTAWSTRAPSAGGSATRVRLEAIARATWLRP